MVKIFTYKDMENNLQPFIEEGIWKFIFFSGNIGFSLIFFMFNAIMWPETNNLFSIHSEDSLMLTISLYSAGILSIYLSGVLFAFMIWKVINYKHKKQII
ncbi:hypothetical protein MKY31_21410 [Bacillus sp. FSL M8-0139]|uniref:hypothetical protein n=1 Tax=Bacillus sp. FSL M8-0139 TaxID=2921613 RepID=UPI0030F80D3B